MRRPSCLALSGFLLLIGALAGSANVKSQQPGQQPAPGTFVPKPVPLPHLYWHFLVYQHHLDDAAAEHKQQGKDGQWLQTYLQKKLGFSDGEFATVRASSVRLTAEIKVLDAQAQAVAQADIAAGKQGLIPAGSAPPGLAQLKALTAQREADINAEIQYLNQTLSAQDAATLQTFLQQRFSKTVTTINRSQPSPTPFTPRPTQGGVQQ
jgi:hypothetical protein